MRVNMHEAKTQLSKLGRLAWEGEEVVIARNGEPYLLLKPYDLPPREPGAWKGKVRVAPDFDEMDQEIIDAFEGDDPGDPLYSV